MSCYLCAAEGEEIDFIFDWCVAARVDIVLVHRGCSATRSKEFLGTQLCPVAWFAPLGFRPCPNKIFAYTFEFFVLRGELFDPMGEEVDV